MDKINALHFAGSDWMLASEDCTPELRDALLDCGIGGQDASESVAFVRATFTVTGEPADCRDMLRGYGAWDDNELSDHDTNLDRLVWLAGCDLREQGEAYFSGY